jgi:phage terminase Nu1 subunit (DNA packaging protein)
LKEFWIALLKLQSKKSPDLLKGVPVLRDDDKELQELFDKIVSSLIIARGSAHVPAEDMRDLAITARQLTKEVWKIRNDL